MSEKSIYVATISPPYESPAVWLSARINQKARNEILRYYMNEYANGGVDVDTDEIEWWGDESYAYLKGIDAVIEVREVELVE